LWHSDRISNKLELGLSCFGKLVVERAKGRMENTDRVAVANALCDSLLWMIIADTGWNLAPSFFWTRERWGSLVRWLVLLP
jgi:hypothetical protein